MLHSKNATTGELGDISQQAGALHFFRRAAANRKGIVEADCIELGVRFLYEPLHVVFVVATMIIASIGKDEQGTFWIMCAAHFAEPEIDGVEERGATSGHAHHHAALQVFDAVGEGAGKLGAFGETDQEEFVLGISGFKKLQGSFARLVHFVAHAAAHVEDYADRNRYVFGGEGDDFLLDVVFVDAKV